MTRQQREKRVIAAIDELDLRKQSHRTVAQVGILLVQMLRLGLEAKAKPDSNYGTKWQTPRRERWNRP